MKTYIIWNASEYRSLEEALANGSGKVIRSAIEPEAMQSLLHDITDYCCHTVFTASVVKGQVADALQEVKEEPSKLDPEVNMKNIRGVKISKDKLEVEFNSGRSLTANVKVVNDREVYLSAQGYEHKIRSGENLETNYWAVTEDTTAAWKEAWNFMAEVIQATLNTEKKGEIDTGVFSA